MDMYSVGSGRSLHELGEFLYSVVLVCLAFIGMGGVVYHCIAPVGVFAPWLGRLWDRHPGFALLVSTGLVVMVLAARGNAMTLRPRTGSNDIPLYFFVALGTFFAMRLMFIGMP
jgi:hypothetical protein